MRSVLTMRNSVVGNNVHRWLDRNEFRGFANWVGAVSAYHDGFAKAYAPLSWGA